MKQILPHMFPVLSILLGLIGHLMIYSMHSRESYLRIESVGESQFIWLAIVIVTSIAYFLKPLGKTRPYIIIMGGLLSLLGSVFAMSVQSSVHSAVSVTEHPSYLIALFGCAGIVTSGIQLLLMSNQSFNRIS